MKFILIILLLSGLFRFETWGQSVPSFLPTGNFSKEVFLHKGLSADSDLVMPSYRTKSTSQAMLLSAAIPGAGQFYTERYWKIPIIWGFGSYFVYQWLEYNKLYIQAFIDYRTSYEGGIFKGVGDSRLKQIRDFYHDERDTFIFYTAVTYLLNIVDAYVGASLFAFEVDDNLGEPAARLTMRITF